MNNRSKAIPTWRVLVGAWRDGLTPDKTDIPLVGISADIARNAYDLTLWGIKEASKDTKKPTLETIADAAASKDLPMWAPVEIEIRKAEFDKEFSSILPGPQSAPPLDLSPGELVCRMAYAWSLVELEAGLRWHRSPWGI
jgi:hypothetical protein